MAIARGQSAVEYMMTYGWGILVVLIAGILLWQMGFLQLSQDVTPDKRGFSQVTPLDWSLTPAGQLTVVIQNNAGTIVQLSTGTSAYMVIGGSGGCTLASPTLPVDNFRPGATQKFVFNGCPFDATNKVGTYYRVNMTINYNNPASGLPHRSNGVIWGPLG